MLMMSRRECAYTTRIVGPTHIVQANFVPGDPLLGVLGVSRELETIGYRFLSPVGRLLGSTPR